MNLPPVPNIKVKSNFTIAQIDAMIETCVEIGKDLDNWDDIVKNKKVIDGFLDDRLALMKKEGKK